MLRLASSIATLILAGSLAAAPHTGVVQAEGTPVPGAAVTAVFGERKLVTTTDELGRYAFDDLTPGMWMLRVDVFGFQAETDFVTVGTEPSSTILIVGLKPRSAAAPPAQTGCVALSDFLLTRTPEPPPSKSHRRSSKPPLPLMPAMPAHGLCSPLRYGTPANGGTLEGIAARFKVEAEMAQTYAAQQAVIAANAQPQPPAPEPVAAPKAETAQAVASPTAKPEAGAEPAKPGQAPRPPAPAGYKVLALKQNGAEGQAGTESQAAPASESGDGEAAFLVSGSVTSGLEQALQEDTSNMSDRQLRDYHRTHSTDETGAPSLATAMAPGFNESGPSLGAMDTSMYRYSRGGSSGGPSGDSGGRGGRSSRSLRRSSSSKTDTTFGNHFQNKNPITGSASYTIANSALNAQHYSLNGTEVPKYSYGSNRFSLSAGGPFTIPKLITSETTFFYLSYSGSRSRSPYNGLTTVPTALERSGNFSQSYAPGPVTIYDPSNGQPFTNNTIPASRFDKAALGLLSYFPLPNYPGLLQNYQRVTTTPSGSDALSARLDQPLSTKDRLSVSFNTQRSGSTSQQLFGFQDTSSGGGFNSSVSWKHYLGPRTITNVSWNLSRNRSNAVPYFANNQSTGDIAATLGIAGTSQLPVNWGPPSLSFTNFGGLSDGNVSVNRSQSSLVNGYLYLSRHHHNVYFGGEYRRSQNNSLAYANARGGFSFSGIATSGFDANGSPLPKTGFDFADFLLGLPQTSSLNYGNPDKYMRQAMTAAYVQDDWRIRHHLTLNLGLRYEYFTPMKEKYGRMADLEINPAFTSVAVVLPGQVGPYSGISYENGLVQPDKNNFSPRVGLAWRPLRRYHVLVRSGYGIYFNSGIYSQIGSHLASQPPFASHAQTLTTSTEQVLTLEQGFPVLPTNTIANTYAVDPNYKIGYAQTWNFILQDTLPHGMLIEVGYLGTKGTNLDIQRMPNRAPPGSPLTAGANLQIQNATSFTYETSEGNSIYNAGDVRVSRRFSRGMSISALYVRSKSIDDVSTFGGGGTTVAQFDNNLALERGLSSFNVPNTLTVQYMITSPFTETRSLFGKGGASPRVLRNWMLSGSMTAADGTPFTATVSGNFANLGGLAAGGSGRAQATGLPLADNSSGFFNTGAFGYPVPGFYGNAGRNTIPGLFRVTANLSLARSFRFGDGARRLEFRVDSSNFLNHPCITGFGTTVNSKTYGVATGAQGMRTVTGTLRFRF